MACPAGLISGFGVDPPANAALCFVKSYFGIGPNGLGLYRTGSGVLIDSGPVRRHVVTAAHNLYHHDVGRQASWVSLWFQREGEAMLATRDAIGWSFPQAFADAGETPGDCDYGVIRVNPLGADRFTGVALALSTASGTTRKLLSGYPDEGPCKGKAMPFHANFAVQPSGPNTYRYVDQPTYAGMSGAPLLANDPASGALRSFGVHIRGGGDEVQRAVRFSQPVYDEIQSWI